MVFASSVLKVLKKVIVKNIHSKAMYHIRFVVYSMYTQSKKDENYMRTYKLTLLKYQIVTVLFLQRSVVKCNTKRGLCVITPHVK